MPEIGMDWRGNLAPGLEGVRLLVVTLLVWAYNIREEEEKEWSRLAYDMLQVLRVLAQQAAGHSNSTENATVDSDEDLDDGDTRRKRPSRKLKKSSKRKLQELQNIIGI
ncbi:unnamed protein product [Peniophora sp. CBMAI 1063]|nr:unnamed protein product [Peniophora sp. CBMAI 1063]